MKLWRVAAETRQYRADDLSGAGAAKNPGRWNAGGEPIVYAARSICLAVLETAAHVDDAGLPLNRFLVELEVPDTLWDARKIIARDQLPATWVAIPAGKGSIDIGSQWLASVRSAILVVPSVIVPEEQVALINPKHPDARLIQARVMRPLEYGRVFRS